MKTLHCYKYIWILFLLVSFSSFSQTPWIQKANYGGGARAWDVEFTIGHYAFVGLGNNGNYLFDFWKWNQTTNTWSAISNYPGAGTFCSTAFSIEGKGYVGLGWTGSAGATDLWRYDTITNVWTRMATFPGVGRYDVEAFVIGHKAYLVGGSIAGPPYLQDVWVYDAHQNSWKQLSNFPGGQVEQYISFAIGNHGYVGDGWFPGCNQDMYEYDTTSDTWTTIPNIPVSYGITEQPDCFVIGSKAYLCTGAFCNAAGLKDGWMYDTVTKSWCGFSTISTDKVARGNAVAFAINNKGYFCTGQDTNLNLLGDLWEYDPSTKINVSDTNNGCIGNDSVHFSETSSYLESACKWTFPGGSPATSNLQNPAVYYSTSGIYTAQLIVIACGGGDTVTRTITVTSGGSGFANIKGKSPVCIGTSDTLTATGGATYLWSNGATNSSIIITPTSNITYSVVIKNGPCQKDTSIRIIVDFYPTINVTGNDTICSGNSTILTASGGSTYLWSNGATTSSISPNPIVTTTYTVKVSNGGCSKDTTINVFVNLSPTLIMGSSVDTVCAGDSVILNVSGANHYTWSPPNGLSCVNCPNPTATPAVSTTYTVTGYGSDGCTSQKTISIVVSMPSTLENIPDQIVCSGGHVTLVANLLSGFGGTYLWQPGGSTSGSITVSPTATTTYSVQYTNVCGVTSTQVTVTVSPMPNPNFSADVTSGCAPLCIQFRDISSGQSAQVTMWRWIFGDGDTLNEENPIYCYRDTGNFTPSLTVVSGDGCSATLQIDKMITVYSKPVANFIYSPNPVYILGPRVQFTDKSTDVYGIYSWTWSFGDEEAGNGQNSLRNPIHTYQDTGTYCPQLIVENNKGCVDTLTQCLFVNPLFTLYIPSAFSPNGDGTNDIFEAKGTYIKNFEMYIFDRWGMELYHTTDISQGWNGTVKGGTNICQEDSYVYKITATDWGNVQHSYVGKVTLVR